ncbi:FliH/SctL family protein [Pseudarthrobacter sp. NPDC092424]|uniref:FliH/SctL family protein n=1 Tax=Pseudarthrobacter sp. NPDC092424 TaxID=3364415 RepID=UPI0037F68593
MPLSTEDGFTQMAFPQLRRPEPESRDDGYVHGHAAGYAAGLRAAETERLRRLEELEADFAVRRDQQQREARQLAGLLQSAAAALDARILPTVSAAEETLVAAAVELAEAVLGYELADRSKAARAALDRALSGSKGLDPVSIRMNPQDLAVLERAAATGVDLGNEPGRTAVVLIPDPALSPGDAIAELPHGFLDAKIGTALARAKTSLAVGAP